MRPVSTSSVRSVENRPSCAKENISQATAMEESIFLNLRLLQRGMLRQEFAARFGTDPVAMLGNELTELARANLVSVDTESIRLTPNGYFLANEVCVRLIAALETGSATAAPVTSR